MPCRHIAARVLLGLNFYGTDFQLAAGKVEHMTGTGYEAVVAAHRPAVTWDAGDAEHVTEYRDEDGAPHVLYYPSARSIQARGRGLPQQLRWTKLAVLSRKGGRCWTPRRGMRAATARPSVPVRFMDACRRGPLAGAQLSHVNLGAC